MFGAKIASIRLARGYSQEWVASRVGITQGAYSKIEKDQKIKLDNELLMKIAEILDVGVEDIKSPMPILINFSNSQSQNRENASFNERFLSIIDSLVVQLEEKDKQIFELILLLKKNTEYE